MKIFFLRGALVIVLTVAIINGGLVSAADDKVANMVINPTLVYWEPLVSYDQLVLTVSGSGGAYLRQVFYAGSSPVFDLYDENGDLFPDGSCNYELSVIPYLDPASRELLSLGRETGTDVTTSSYSTPTGISQFGVFTIKDGLVVMNTVLENAPTVSGIDGIDQMQESIDTTQDQLINDDLIVVGSACVGQDCYNGENFGFDTIRLKENNLRIRFMDTSNSGSFPSTDWQLTANDSINGGANKFSIDDLDSGRTPFTIEASAPTNALYVDDGGRVGFGTSTPVVELHVTDGDTPTLRLEQNGSSGFTPQTWDVAGNEANFFIRDVTNGGKLSFKIKPSAPENSLYVDANGKIGLGTSSPQGTLHVSPSAATSKPFVVTTTGDVGVGTTTPDTKLNVFSTDGTAKLHVEDTMADSSNAAQTLGVLENQGGVRLDFVDNSRSLTWALNLYLGNFSIVKDGTGIREFEIKENGDVVITGSLTTSGGSYPDYVFDDGYKLMPLSDLGQYIKNNNKLPEIPPAEELEKNGVNMTHMQIKLLKKIEELTLYTLAQQKTIDELKAKLEMIQK